MSFKQQLTKLKENWLLIALILVVVVLFSGIGSIGSLGSSLSSAKYMAESNYADMGVARGGYYPSPVSEDFRPDIETRIITKTASMSNEVERGSFSAAENQMRGIVAGNKGYILNENVNTYDQGRKEYQVGYYSIKIDTKQYETVLDQLKAIGEVKSFNENAQDITGQYTNTNDQLEVERDRLKRYQALFDEAKSIEDKLNLEDRIFNQERTIKYLEDSVDNMDLIVEYSTVSFTLNEKQSSYANVQFTKLSQLVRSFVDSFNALLNLLFIAVPWLIGLVIVIVGYKFFKRK